MSRSNESEFAAELGAVFKAIDEVRSQRRVYKSITKEPREALKRKMLGHFVIATKMELFALHAELEKWLANGAYIFNDDEEILRSAKGGGRE